MKWLKLIDIKIERAEYFGSSYVSGWTLTIEPAGIVLLGIITALILL